jgi:hypothetical protein
MSKHTFTLLFRGELVREFTSIHDVQAVRLGYRRFHAKGQSHLELPTGSISRKPEVLRQMKTVAALKRDSIAPQWATYPDQTFVVLVRPGTTEITDESVLVEGAR